MKVYPKVLFVTNKDDFAVDFLIYKFIDYKIPYIRINSEDIVNLNINYNFDNASIQFGEREYDLRNIESAYFRRSPTIFPSAQDQKDTSFINRERRDFLEGLYLTLNCKWVNPIFSTYIAERKIFQLKMAKEIGFKTPKTISTNSPKEVISFIKQYNDCIIKPICHGLQITDDKIYSIYTSDINDLNYLNNDLLFESPILIQEKIEKYRDIRSTLIGNQLFSVEIETDDKDRVDWRKPNLKKTYESHTVPKDLEILMKKFHKNMGLVYSAFDFILTPDGDYCFLETNPAGEWVWLERELNIPISNAIINELIN